MNWIILIICLIILVETTILTIRRIKPSRTNRHKIYVDTSALIDGRIIDIAKSGFMDADLIILKSVLLELQLLADGKDSDKRNLARRGLSTASELERVINVNTEIVDDTGGLRKVDEELLKYAKENKGAILTIDYNLIKVAEAEKIETLNINDLSLALRGEHYLGEKIKVHITDKGSNRGQGIGHLLDGTMVVVDNAANKIGQDVNIELVNFHETSAGRMIFGRITKKKTT